MTKSELFKAAHKLARNTVKVVGNYSIAFSLALKETYKMTVKAVKTLEQKAIELGGNVWEKNDMKRVYITLAMFNELTNSACRLNESKNKFYVENNQMFRRYKNGKPTLES